MNSIRTQQEVFQAISQTKIIPVFYHDDVQTAKEMIKACYDGGIRVFEWVDRDKKAASYFPEIKQYITTHCEGMILGVGTILSDNQAEQFIEMGASFLVSPVYSADVMDKAYYAKVPYIPGCFTPTEVFNAFNAGCAWVKIFPGDAITPAYIKNIKTVMPQVNIMVTGGVIPQKENIQQWLSNGADAVGIGSQLFKEFNYQKVVDILNSLQPL
jgi:2-dehydro-3-deoxyphosphogluconate aldolase / (4S)-4-hydroxy-2-oxoglutarate aldolase